MGPPDKKPAFPILDTYNQPGCRMVPLIQHFYPCNWLQIQENVMDPAHLEFLHTITGSHFPEELRMHRAGLGGKPVWDDLHRHAAGDENIWVRINEYIPPNIRQFPAGGPSKRVRCTCIALGDMHFTVPVDDTPPCSWASCAWQRAGGAARGWLWPDGRPAIRGEAARARGLRRANQHPWGSPATAWNTWPLPIVASSC